MKIEEKVDQKYLQVARKSFGLNKLQKKSEQNEELETNGGGIFLTNKMQEKIKEFKLGYKFQN